MEAFFGVLPTPRNGPVGFLQPCTPGFGNPWHAYHAGTWGHFTWQATSSPDSRQLLPPMEPELFAADKEEAASPALSSLGSMAGSWSPEPRLNVAGSWDASLIPPQPSHPFSRDRNPPCQQPLLAAPGGVGWVAWGQAGWAVGFPSCRNQSTCHPWGQVPSRRATRTLA